MSINREYLRNLKADTERRALEQRTQEIAQIIINDVIDFAKISTKHHCTIGVNFYVNELGNDFLKVVEILRNVMKDVSIVFRTHEFDSVVLSKYVEINEPNKLVLYEDRYDIRYTLCLSWE